jgi:hypothetical protein
MITMPAMKLRLGIVFALLAVLTVPTHAQSLMGIMTHQNGGGSPPPSYTGPGDVVGTGTVVWYGLRAYNATQASAGAKAVNVCLASNASCTDMVVDSAGDLVVTTVGGSSCGSVSCFVHTIYDQSGVTACGSGSLPCDMVQTTAADQPRFIINCIGSLPCIQFSSGSQGLSSTSGITGHSTASGSTMTGFAGVGGTIASGSFEVGGCSINFANLGFNNAISADDVYMFNGGTPYLQVGVTTGAGVYHSLVGVANAASSVLVVDGTVNSGTVTNSGDCSTAALNTGFTDTGHTNTWTEYGLWTTIFNSTQYNAMSSNISSYW